MTLQWTSHQGVQKAEAHGFVYWIELSLHRKANIASSVDTGFIFSCLTSGEDFSRDVCQSHANAITAQIEEGRRPLIEALKRIAETPNTFPTHMLATAALNSNPEV